MLLKVAENDNSESYIEAHLLLGRLYLLGQESGSKETTDRAETHLQMILDRNAEHPSALAALGKIYMVRDEDYSRANEYLSRAAEISPEDEKVLFDYGISLLYVKEIEEARNIFERAARVNPTIDRNVVGQIAIHDIYIVPSLTTFTYDTTSFYRVGKIYLYFKQVEWAVTELEAAFQVQFHVHFVLMFIYTLERMPSIEVLILANHCFHHFLFEIFGIF